MLVNFVNLQKYDFELKQLVNKYLIELDKHNLFSDFATYRADFFTINFRKI